MLEFLEVELKNKENQLSGLHSRLDEKQKEYSNKLEHYQKIFEQNRARLNELEEENHQLKQAPRQEMRQTQEEIDSEALVNNEHCLQLQKELQAEKEKCKALHADLFNEKSSLISLDIKYGDLERTIQEQDLKIDDLEHTLHEKQIQISKLEVEFVEDRSFTTEAIRLPN
jgi:chromosome segregation ATPase